MIYRVARRLTAHEQEAEDLVQETYLKAHRAFARYRKREFGIKPWLLKILYNTYLDRQAARRRAPVSLDQHTLEQMRGNGPAAPEKLSHEDLDQEVKQAIDNLPAEYRSVLLLWATAELSYQEIADLLGIPIGTVMSRLHRARQQLKDALADFARQQRIATVRERP